MSYCCHFASLGASTVGSTQALCVYVCVKCLAQVQQSHYHPVIHMQSQSCMLQPVCPCSTDLHIDHLSNFHFTKRERVWAVGLFSF